MGIKTIKDYLLQKLRHALFDVFTLVMVIVLFIIWLNAVRNTKQELKEERETIDPVEIVETDTTLIDYDYEQLYSYKEQEYNDSCLTITVDEADLLMKIARSEGGDSKGGQLWVMGVILNRLNDDRFPNTIKEVISQSGQFEVYRTGIYKNADVNVNSHLALADLESGINPTQGAVWFESNSNSDHSWHKSKDFIAEVDGNRFYK